MADLFGSGSGEQVDAKRILKILRALNSTVLTPDVATALDPKERRAILKALRQMAPHLATFEQSLDHVGHPDVVFDPAHPETVGQLIAMNMLGRPRSPLGKVPTFYGSGVYALYYNGDFPAYAPVKKKDWPIYVGKADPKTPGASTPREQGPQLAGRLREHAESVGEAKNLRIEDFDCRYLVVVSAWQKTAEQYLINRFKPVWNKEMRICQGFGKHGDLVETRGNRRSLWDTLHPGRDWATEGNIDAKLNAQQIAEKIAEHYQKYPPAT